MSLPVRVMGAVVQGNRTTKEHIIARELTVREGDTLSVTALYEQLERSRQNLQNLGLFNTVDVLPLWISATEALVEVTVKGLDGGFFRSELASTFESGAALIVFFSQNLEVTEVKVKKAGGVVNKEIFSFPGGRRFHFIEPSGNEFAVWSEVGA